MNKQPRIAAICGSLRDRSTTRTALAHTLAAAQDHGAKTELIDLREYELPIYDGDAKNAGDAPALQRSVSAADGIILGTPIYHGSYASGLKTALDYCGFDEFEQKPVGFLAVGGGRFPTPAILHLHAVCVWLRAHPLPHHVSIPNVSSVVKNGEITDSDTAQRAETLGEKVTEFAIQFASDLRETPTIC